MDAPDRIDRTARVLAGVFGVTALVGATWLVAADRTVLHDVPRRLAHARELRLDHWMAIGFRRAALASMLVGVLGAASVRWWGRPGPRPGGGWRIDQGTLNPAGRKRFLWAVVLCLLIGAGFRVPRLGHSFWNDEAYAARAYVWGVKELQPDGSVVFKPVSWPQALFQNEKGNNHVWCSIEARMALRAWQSLTGHGPDEFSEAAMRFPAFVWGLLTIAAVSRLGTLMVGPHGWVAGLLLAVHPWHVRFSVEMRGYSAMLLALTAGVIFLLLALRDGRWRWWLLAAAMNLWGLLAFAGCLYVPVVANAAALGWLLWKRERVFAGRLLVANAMAAIPFLWLYGPSLPQLAHYLRSGAAAAAYQIDAGWFRSLWSCLCLGADWSVMSAAWRGSIILRTPLWQSIALGGASFLFIVQAIRWLRARRPAGAVPLVFLLAGVLGIAQNILTRSPALAWYFLPMVLGWVFIMIGPPAVDAARASGAVPRRPSVAWSSVAWSLVAGVGAAGLAGNAAGFLGLEHHPMRAAAAHPGVPSASPVTAAVGVSDRQMLLYDPRVAIVHTVADLENSERAAAAANQPLVVCVCGWDESQRRVPAVMNRLRLGGYKTVAELPGWEPMFSYRLLRRTE